MSKLYIANCTKQIQEIHYRVPENARILVTIIPPGEQRQIYQDTTPDVITHIVDQHAMYGLVPVEEIDRTRNFIGICYSIDKPIAQEKIMDAALHNDDVLTHQGHENRKAMAAAVSSSIDQSNEGTGNNLNSLQMETEEVVKRGQSEDDAFKERLQVQRDPQAAAPARKKGRR